MKKLIVTASLISMCLSLASFAEETASTIKENMHKIGVLSKAIGRDLSDADKNSESADEAGQMAVLFRAVYALAPEAEAIVALPADQRAAAIADFQKLIQNEIDDSIALQKALLTNDNATATTIYSDMIDTKQDGHGKYIPE